MPRLKNGTAMGTCAIIGAAAAIVGTAALAASFSDRLGPTRAGDALLFAGGFTAAIGMAALIAPLL